MRVEKGCGNVWRLPRHGKMSDGWNDYLKLPRCSKKSEGIDYISVCRTDKKFIYVKSVSVGWQV